VDRRRKSFGSSDRTGVGGCGSQSGSNGAVSAMGGGRRQKIQEDGSDLDLKNRRSID